MGRTTKRVKPPFAKNASDRAKALGLNWIDLAKKARLPHPTVRDILAGISPGLEENKAAIAKALGVSMSDLYHVDTPPAKPRVDQLKGVIEAQKGAVPLRDMLPILQEFSDAEPSVRALMLAILYDDHSISSPYPPRTAQGGRAAKAK